MEFLSDNITYSIALFIIGILTGVALAKVLNRGPSVSELQDQVEEANKNLENYQTQVSEHFQETAQLVNTMSQSYRDVHNHLSKGAQALAVPNASQLENVQFTALSEPSEIIDEPLNNDDPSNEAPLNQYELSEAEDLLQDEIDLVDVGNDLDFNDTDENAHNNIEEENTKND